MFAFFSIGIGQDLKELRHVQAHIPQDQRICSGCCKRYKGPIDGADVNLKNVYLQFMFTGLFSPRKCFIQLVLVSSQ